MPLVPAKWEEDEFLSRTGSIPYSEKKKKKNQQLQPRLFQYLSPNAIIGDTIASAMAARDTPAWKFYRTIPTFQ